MNALKKFLQKQAAPEKKQKKERCTNYFLASGLLPSVLVDALLVKVERRGRRPFGIKVFVISNSMIWFSCVGFFGKTGY